MMPYKNIDDNLTTREFNGIVSLLRDNVRFNEDIQINTHNVNGAYGEYQFNFHEATMLDNGVLITNQTLTTIGTVKLVNPAFPHSNYYLDLKVYSSEDIGVLDEEDVLVTPLTVKLVKDTEVNIPFETLEMNNIIGFDATVRIDHKDLVLNTGDNLELSCDYTSSILYIPIPFKIKYFNGDLPVSGKTVSLYEGETLLGTGVTGLDGYATVEVSFNSLGTHTVTAKAGLLSSNSLSLDVIDGMILNVTGSSFSTDSSNPFTYNGRVYVDWGDDTGLVEYTGGKLSHRFTDGESNHTVKVYGDITSLRNNCFVQGTGLTSITIPSSVTSLGRYCFEGCTGLTSINIPSSVTTLGFGCFESCTGLTSITIPSSVTSLGENCFNRCTGLTSINIPSSVISLGNYWFRHCTGLTSIILNWASNDILTYQSTWIVDTSSNLKFIIPQGTTNLYIAKGYPSDKLRENIPFDDLTLTSDKDILSYNDGTNPDTAILTAQLTYEGEPVAVSGETVTFEVRKQSDDSLVETLSDVTDSSGVATVSYTSKGAGDLYIKADCVFVSKTYAIQDCIEYQPLTSNAHQSRWTIPSNTSVSYDNNGMNISASSWADLYLTTQISKPCSIEWEIGQYSLQLFNIYLWDTSKSTRYLNAYLLDSGTTANRFIFDIYNSSANYISFVPSVGDIIRIEVDNNECRAYVNDVLKISKSHSHISPFLFGLAISSNRYTTYKNLKIKPL